MSSDWDSDEARAFAARLDALWTSLKLPLEAPPPRASRAAAWLWRHIDLVGAAESLDAGERWKAIEQEPPPQLRSMMMEATKPFTLWNVRRDEGPEETEFKFEKGPELKVGGAAGAAAKTREGMPGKVRFATKALLDDIEERWLLRTQAFNRKKVLRNTLRSDLAEEGLGIPDDAPPPTADAG